MTKLESQRIARMMRLGCIACAWIDVIHIAQECHHLLDGGRRMGHSYTIPLCMGHHRGIWSAEQREVLGGLCVAISDSQKFFSAVYPTERLLWEMVQIRLKLPLLWPVSKIVPRNVA